MKFIGTKKTTQISAFYALLGALQLSACSDDPALAAKDMVPANGNGGTTAAADGIANAKQEPADSKETQLSYGSSGHVCVPVAEEKVKCWGGNEHGELGDGTTENRNVPVEVPGLRGVKQVAFSFDTTCALLHTGTIQCWGDNTSGVLGNGSTANAGPHTKPEEVKGIFNATSIDLQLDTRQVFATLADGTVVAWGWNGQGELGAEGAHRGTQATPVVVAGVRGATAVAGNGTGGCAIVDGGKVVCFGAGFDAPQEVAGITQARQLSQQCATLENGNVVCWGPRKGNQESDGRLVLTNRIDKVRQVSGIRGATAITSMLGTSCAVVEGGRVFCWTDFSDPEEEVPGLVNVTSILTTFPGYCVTLSTGAMKCWGSNENGKLGDGTNITSEKPVDVKL
jgi:Regulator of chromosome condensation (RCC1) repeat